MAGEREQENVPGPKRVGHFGFFAERSRETLWRESLDWLRARL